MAEETSERSASGREPFSTGFGGFVAQFKTMFQVLRASSGRAGLFWLDVGLIGVIAATAYWQIELNAWNKPFYDALSRRHLPDFSRSSACSRKIAGALLVLNVAQTWFNQMLRMKMREAFTRDLFAEWLAPRRMFLLSQAGEIGVNPDQRIHEDARHLADLTTDLGIGLLQAALLLVCFIGVLWGLSAGVALSFDGRSWVIPGYMVWCALIYAGVASAASGLVGRPLIGLNAEHYARESDLRFALVHLNEHGEDVALYRGEATEAQRLDVVLRRLLIVLRRLVGATTRLTWVTAGYGWFTIVAPIIVAAPAYFDGNLTFGGLLMSAGAFTQVQQSLRWFIDNAGALGRLARDAAPRRSFPYGADRHGRRGARREPHRDRGLDGGSPSHREFGGLSSRRHRHAQQIGGRARARRAHVHRRRAGAGKTSLFRALAGLWPRGVGPNCAYRAGATRDVHAQKPLSSPEGACAKLWPIRRPRRNSHKRLMRARLRGSDWGGFCPDLDRRSRWDQELSDPEQQALAFARLRLHEPSWVVIDEALEAIRPRSAGRGLRPFRQGACAYRRPLYRRAASASRAPGEGAGAQFRAQRTGARVKTRPMS